MWLEPIEANSWTRMVVHGIHDLQSESNTAEAERPPLSFSRCKAVQAHRLSPLAGAACRCAQSPLRGYVGQRRPHKLVITAQRDRIAVDGTGRIDPMMPTAPRERRH